MKKILTKMKELTRIPLAGETEANRQNFCFGLVGTVLLGYKVGDTVVWKVPSGMRKLKNKEMLYQPESAGNWYQ